MIKWLNERRQISLHVMVMCGGSYWIWGRLQLIGFHRFRFHRFANNVAIWCYAKGCYTYFRSEIFFVDDLSLYPLNSANLLYCSSRVSVHQYFVAFIIFFNFIIQNNKSSVSKINSVNRLFKWPRKLYLAVSKRQMCMSSIWRKEKPNCFLKIGAFYAVFQYIHAQKFPIVVLVNWHQSSVH